MNEYYVRNFSEESVSIILSAEFSDTVRPSVGPLFESTRASQVGTLNQPVNFTQDGDVFLIVVPPRTAVFLGFSSGGNDLFTGLQLFKASDPLNVIDYTDGFSVHDDLVGAVIHVLDIR